MVTGVDLLRKPGIWRYNVMAGTSARNIKFRQVYSKIHKATDECERQTALWPWVKLEMYWTPRD